MLADTLGLMNLCGDAVISTLSHHLLLTSFLSVCSLAAFLNGGVVIRSSNLAMQGSVSVRAQAMGHSASRIAAKQHSIFHGQKKPGEP